jgi:tetratricopeptide (TPR) repeat protein
MRKLVVDSTPARTVRAPGTPGRVAPVALLVLACAAGSAAAQATLPCTGPACGPAISPWAGAAELFQRKQAFVTAVRELSISLTGRFGDEGSRLRSDLDALDAALRQWDQAIAAFENALRAGVLDADVHTALGSVYLDRYRLDDALRSFGAAATLEPRRADTYRFIAMTHGLARHPAEAAQAWARAAALRPDDAEVRYEIVRYATGPGDPSPSSEIFKAFRDAAAAQLAREPVDAPFTRPALLRQTAGVAPIFPPAPYVRGFELLMNGRFEEAIAECRRALAGDPLLDTAGNPDRLLAGSEALRRGDLPGALRELAAAVAADPGRSEAHRILAVASRLDEQLDQSVQAFSTAIRLRADDERARLGLADVLIDLERFDVAEALLRETIRVVTPESVLGHYRLGRLLQARGRYDDALTELEAAARFAPLVGQDPLYEMVALLYATQADFPHAIEALRKQVAVNPNNADAHRRLGDSYVRLDRPAEALTEFTAALLVDRRNVLSYVGIAQLQARTGNHADAVRAATSAIALDPAHKEARYVLATSLARLGRADEARAELETFQRLQSEDAAAAKRKFERDGLARQIAVSMGAADHAAAIPLLRQLIALEPEVATHYVTLGLALTGTRQPLEAIQAFEAALKRDVPDPNVYRYLAEAYLAAGQTDAGRQAAARYREAMEFAKKQRALRFAGS